MARAHGGLANAGKVRKATPKVQKRTDKHREVVGRALKRKQYKKYFGGALILNGKPVTPNSFLLRKAKGLTSE